MLCVKNFAESAAETMQFLLNLFFLAHHHRNIFGLRVIDNGVGFPVHGAEENVVDYALLAADQKATLPSQVQTFVDIQNYYSVHHLLVCNNECLLNQSQLLHNTSSFWESLDFIL